MTRDPKVCAHCGTRVGVYEPINVEYGDGTLEATAWLNIPSGRAMTRAWHAACWRATRPAAE